MSGELLHLPQALQDLHIPFTERELEQCLLYLNELHLWNRKMNLSGARSVEQLEIHLIDSLLGKPFVDSLNPTTAVDLGSGAGFPALPLAIFNDTISWSLVERSHRRCGFLQVVVALLGLQSRVRVLEQPAEHLITPVDIVTFRAFRPVEVMHETFQAYLHAGATLVMYKGKLESSREELHTHPLGGKSSLHPVSHALVHGERTICIIEE